MEKIDILILENSIEDAMLEERQLKKDGLDFTLQIVENEDDFLKSLNERQPDIILSDYNLPQFTGLEALEIAKTVCPTTPFIIVTGSLDEETAVQCIKVGATDYILKDNLMRLGSAVNQAMKLHEEQMAKISAEKELEKNERRYRTLTENSPDSILRFDRNHCIIFMNKTFRVKSGLAAQEFLGSRIGDIPKYSLISEELENILSTTIENETLQEKILSIGEENNKIVYDIRSIAEYGEDNQLDSILLIMQDITQLFRYQLSYYESKAESRAILDNIPHYAWLENVTGEYTIINKSLNNNLYGYDKSFDVNDSPFMKLLQDSGKQISSESDERFYEVKIPSDNGYNWYECYKHPILDHETKLSGYAGIALNITERKQAELENKRRIQFENTILKCMRLLMEDEPGVIKTILDELRTLTETSKVYISENHSEKKSEIYYNLIFESCESETTSRCDEPHFEELSWEKMPHTKDLLSHGETVYGNISSMPEEDRIFFNTNSIISILYIPVFIGKSWFGTLGFENIDYELKWNKYDIPPLKTIAETMGFFFERQKSQKILEKSEHHYRAVFENTGTAMVLTSEDGMITMCNQGFAKLSGDKKKNIEGQKNIFQYLYNRDENSLNKESLDNYSSNDLFPKQEEIIFKQMNEDKIVLTQINRIDVISRFVFSFIDISDKVKLTQQLSERNKTLHSFYRLDMAMESENTIPELLQKAAEIILVGFVNSENISCCINYNDYEFRSGEFFEGGNHIFQTFHSMKEGKGKLTVYKNADHRFKPKEVEFIRAYSIRLNNYISRVHSKNALIQSENKFRTMFNSMKESMILLEVNWNDQGIDGYTCIDVNPAFLKLFQKNLDECQNKKRKEIFSLEDPLIECFKSYIESGKSSFENRYKLLEKYLLISVSFMTDDILFAVITDITENKLLENQLIHAQKMESIGQLAGGVAHDFNNYLMAIQSYATLMEMKTDNNEKMGEYVKQIIAACTKAASVAHSLLMFSRREEIHPEATRIIDLISDIKVIIKQVLEENVEMVVEIENESVLVSADAGKIQQVLLNLATNARDAMNRRGIFSIKTTSKDPSVLLQKKYGIDPGGHFLCISVSDTGKGMSEEVIEQMFDPFFTTKDVGKGTGLGLSVSYGIISQHGGVIDVQSKIGYGTTIDIYLPLSSDDREKKKPTSETGELHGDESLLIVDDQKEIRISLQHILSQYGYSVNTTDSGEDAIRKIQENPDKYDLLLIDVRLPGLTGIEVAERIEQINASIHVLYMSGYSKAVLIKEYNFDPANEVTIKPIVPEKLIQMIRSEMEADE